MKMFVGGSFTTDFLTWMVRETGALRLEEAHHALSALPAQMAGLKNRGMLLEGQPADVVVYDMEKLGTIPEHFYDTVYDLPGGDWRRVKRARIQLHHRERTSHLCRWRADGCDAGSPVAPRPRLN